jgi:phage-related protein
MKAVGRRIFIVRSRCAMLTSGTAVEIKCFQKYQFPNWEIPYLYRNVAMHSKFELEFLPEAVEFLEHLDSKAREKIYYNLKKAQFVSDDELFKKLNDHIWEFRTLYNNTAYRLFSFWDKSYGKRTIVVATHGIVKKTQKTPVKEIEKAEKIRKQYLGTKGK